MIGIISDRGQVYKVATEDKVYWLAGNCKIGKKPIAIGDTIHFRLDKKRAYMAPVTGSEYEQKLNIVFTELRETPRTPTAPSEKSYKEVPLTKS